MLLLTISLLVGLPPLGVALADKPAALYLEFPPLTRYVEHAPFSWPAFIGLALLVLTAVGPVVVGVLTSERPVYRPEVVRTFTVRTFPVHAFPWWGWLGICATAVAWILAWTRFSWFEPFQPFTFTSLWLGYILVINALTFRRTGKCLLVDHPGYFLALFPLSAVFWWFFEYLNRFVQNWYYVGISELSPVAYALFATLPFLTVLPAVLGTIEWLASFPRLNEALRHRRVLRITHGRLFGWIVLVSAGAGLTGIGVWPDYLFPLLWLSPLLILTSLQAVFGRDTIFKSVRDGDWRPIWLPAFAALQCGFFWEMWNYGSLVHWVYTVPYVHRFQLFEMPLLGYAGYLPFGLECLVIVNVLPGSSVLTAFRSWTPERD